MENKEEKQVHQNKKIPQTTNTSNGNDAKPLPKTSYNYDPDDDQDSRKKYNCSQNVTQNHIHQTNLHPLTQNYNQAPSKEELKITHQNQISQKLYKTHTNLSENIKLSHQQSHNNNQQNLNNISHQQQNLSKIQNQQQQQKRQEKSQEKPQKLLQKPQKSQKQTQNQALDNIDPSKRLRDWQQKVQTPIVPFKKRYEFCQGSIVFNIDTQYELQKLIGSGIYGIVASGRNKSTNQPVAIKKISKLFNNFGDTRRVLRQIKVLQFLNHKNIIALQGIMTIDNPSTFNQIYLIMEFMEFDLRRLIQSQMKITEQMIKFIMYQLLVSINFMHSADILHRDLKPENILMNKKCELKLADMNLARKETYTGNITDYVASRPYRAPQILIGSTVYTKSVDIWSIGCIFAELLGKTIIFHGKDYIDQLKRFVAILGKPKIEYFPNIDKTSMESLTKLIAQIPDKEKVEWKYLMPNISDKAADLLDRMLTYDSRARYNAQDCLNHPYLEEYKRAPRIKCKQVFDFSFDKIQLKQCTLRQAIFNASKQFNAKMLNKNSQKLPSPIQKGDEVVKKVKTQ